MLINRHNYEEFFLLYVDNELPVADRKAVESFVEQNPDLEEELVMMMQSVLRPDTKIVFTNKESLLKNKPVNGLVNESNYEEYFLLYGDNELSNEEKDLVEQFVYKHPQYQAEFELIQQARLIPEHATMYPDKNELYRTEDDDRVIPFRWWRIAAAAIVLLFLGVTAWYLTNNDNSGNVEPSFANKENDTVKNPAVRSPLTNNNQVADVKENKQPATDIKEESAPVNDVKKNLANNDEKNIKKKSNIEVKKIVPQERTVDGFVNNDQKKAVEEPLTDQGEESKVVVKPMYASIEKSTPATFNPAHAAVKEPGTALNKEEKAVYYYIDEQTTEDDIKLANASINKKPVRGLIRKVKGLFEGNNDDNEQQPEQEKKKGIRIAAFSIALK